MLHQSYLNKKFTYDQNSGELLRKRKAATPTPAGNPRGKTSLAGVTYAVTDIAYAMGTGAWPERPTKTLDGTLNLRLDNIVLTAPGEPRPSIKQPEAVLPDPEEFFYYP